MSEPYKSAYYPDLNYFVEKGWTTEEIETYFPYLESAPLSELIMLHELVNGEMLECGEAPDKEQALHVMLNPDDTPKALLISAIKRLWYRQGRRTDLSGAVIQIDGMDLLITAEAAKLIREGFDMILLRRLFDAKDMLFPLAEVTTAIAEEISDWM